MTILNRRILCPPIVLILLLSGCNFPVSTDHVTEPEPPDVENVQPPVEIEILPEDAFATLKILRKFTAPLGEVTIEASIPIEIILDSGSPTLNSPVMGAGNGFLNLVMIAQGSGGSHTTTAQGEVTYDIQGTFFPHPQCSIKLDVNEVVLYSKGLAAESTVFGTLPPIEGIPDEVTIFKEITFPMLVGPSNPVPGSVITNEFTITDLVLPEWTGCTVVE